MTTFDVEAKKDSVCKLHLDLWLHQNTLMWSRVQTLWFVQGGFLALANLMRIEKELRQAQWICVICVVATFGLWVVMWTDRNLRNIHRISIEKFELDLHPASVDQIDLREDKGTIYVEPLFHAAIFLVFITMDLAAAHVFGMPPGEIASCAFAVFVGAAIMLLVYARRPRRAMTPSGAS